MDLGAFSVSLAVKDLEASEPDCRRAEASRGSGVAARRPGTARAG